MRRGGVRAKWNLGVQSSRCAVSAIGHSSGAITLMHMATAQPDRAQALILAAAPHYFTEEWRDTLSSGICEERLAPRRAEWHAGGLDQMLTICKQIRSMAASVTDVNFTPPRLATIRAPTLIIYGDRDIGIPVEQVAAGPAQPLLEHRAGHARVRSSEQPGRMELHHLHVAQVQSDP